MDGGGGGSGQDAGVPTLTIGDATITEGNSGTTTATFTVTLSPPSSQSVTALYGTSDGTASGQSDYAPASGTLTFAPNETTQTISVTVNGDALNEADETFTVKLLNATGAAIGDGEATGTITDDDPLPSLSVNDIVFLEGDSGTSMQTFTVTLSEASGRAVMVDYATADGSATVAGNDYAQASGTLTFNPGETSKTVSVTITGDTLNEGNETFDLNLSNAVNAVVSKAKGTATIANDDSGLPVLSINDVQVNEVDSGSTVNAIFTVTLSVASGNPVTVDYVTVDNSATSPNDYLPTVGTLIFNPGETSKQITVTVNGDVLNEATETFYVDLSNANQYAVIAKSRGVGTINDNDNAPTISIDDITVTEGAAGTTNATFTVSLSAPSGRSIAVQAATSDGTATAGGGVGGNDYVTTSTTLTFPPGTTQRTVSVPVNGDTLDEPNELFYVDLTNAQNATIADSQGTATINDDDLAPEVSINDAANPEGDTGTTPFVFTVSLSAQSGQTVTVDYATADGTATAGSDYTAKSGTLTFNPGETSKTITVDVSGDATQEPNESFTVALSNPTNATLKPLGSTGTGTIQDDDSPLPQINIGDATASESSPTMTFTVTLSPSSSQTVTVQYATANGTAVAGQDYNAGNGTITFNAGETQKQISIGILQDTLDEDNETFLVNLSNATNATIVDGQAQGTINDDDPLPSLSISDAAAVTEGNSGKVTTTFTVTLSVPSGRTVRVNWSTANGTAQSGGGVGGNDYDSASGTLTFNAGETSKQVTVQVNGDLLDEADETFFVNLSGAVNANIGDGQGQGTITDDDPLPVLSINDVSRAEGNLGNTRMFTFTVTLSAVSGRTVTVNFATADGTAQTGLFGDYNATSGTLTFNPGDTSQTIDVRVIGDNTQEQDETFFVNLSNATNATIGDSQGVGTIINDDN